MPSMPHEPLPMSDPRVLRAIAHPTRARILDELSATGPMRAADVGEALGIPANQASFHLRQLAKYGVIQPAPEAARDKRDRVWKLLDERGFRLDMKAISEQPGGRSAVAVFRQNTAARAHRLVDEVFTFERKGGGVNAVIDQPLRLTEDEAAELVGQVDEVLAAWAERTRGRTSDRTTYAFYSMLLPYPEDVPEP
jgi:DNA-binding transcriptional ArsR family regulator